MKDVSVFDVNVDSDVVFLRKSAWTVTGWFLLSVSLLIVTLSFLGEFTLRRTTQLALHVVCSFYVKLLDGLTVFI